MRAARIAGLLAGAVLAVSAFCLASSADSITLTPEQTLALYGTQFSALVGDAYSDNISTITFDYAFTLNSVGYMDAGGGFSSGRFANSLVSIDGSSLTSAEIRDIWARSQGLVYVADASQWGNTAFTPYDHDQMNGAVQLHVPFSVTIGGVTRFQQNIFFSTKRNADYQRPVSYPQYDVLKILTDIANVDFLGVRAQYSNYYVSARATLPTYPYYQDGNQLSENDLGYFAGWITDLYESNDFDESFSISGQTIDCYCVNSVSRNNNNIWLIVCCPTLTDYAPTTTTIPATTRKPAETGYDPIGTAETGVDLDFIATDLAEIIRNQRHQIAQLDVENRNSRIIANNTAEIVNILNKIYEKMAQSGQIPIDGTFMQDIQNALTSYTTARIPGDASAGLTFWAWFMGKIMEQAWIAELAALGSFLAVTYFILFRGRNS